MNRHSITYLLVNDPHATDRLQELLHPRGFHPQDIVARARKLYAGCNSATMVAEQLGVSLSSLRRWGVTGDGKPGRKRDDIQRQIDALPGVEFRECPRCGSEYGYREPLVTGTRSYIPVRCMDCTHYAEEAPNG